MNEINHYVPNKLEHQYHGVVTIPLYELIDGGFVKWYTMDEDGKAVIPNRSWVWDYYDLTQYKRVCDKFNARFMWDEISMLPPLRWRQQVIRIFNEVMPKYKPLYKALDDGIDILQIGNKYGKYRDIYSEFPETLLNGNSDYVSSGKDHEYEDVELGNYIEKAEEIYSKYNDVDVMILNELECMFTSLCSVNMNCW